MSNYSINASDLNYNMIFDCISSSNIDALSLLMIISPIIIVTVIVWYLDLYLW